MPIFNVGDKIRIIDGAPYNITVPGSVGKVEQIVGSAVCKVRFGSVNLFPIDVKWMEHIRKLSLKERYANR